MTSLDAYRIALVEGLTAKQAGAKFNLNYTSVAKCKNRYGLPSLKNEWDAGYEEQLGKLTDLQLLKYYNLLLIPKNKRSAREFNVCKMLIEKRRLCTN
jgi:hypothetical protein